MYPITFIQPDVLYTISATSSDTNYNGVTYSAGTNFRGVYGATAFSPIDSAVFELTEIRAGGIEFATNALDYPTFPETTNIQGAAIEFSLNPEEEIVNEVTKITGFSIEFLYYSPYVFQISRYVTPPSNAGEVTTSTTTTTTTGPQYTFTSQSFAYGTYSFSLDGLSLNLYDSNNNNQLSTSIGTGVKTTNTPNVFTFPQTLAPFTIKAQGLDNDGDGVYHPVDAYLNGSLVGSNIGGDNSIVTISDNVSDNMVLEFLNVGENYADKCRGMIYFKNQGTSQPTETFVLKILDSSLNVLLTTEIPPVFTVNGTNYEAVFTLAFEQFPVGANLVSIFTTGDTYTGNFVMGFDDDTQFYTGQTISSIISLSIGMPTRDQVLFINAGF